MALPSSLIIDSPTTSTLDNLPPMQAGLILYSKPKYSVTSLLIST